MIRSYVLVWSFVFCRLVQRGDLGDLLGPDASGLIVWLTWVGPLLACEVVLKWGGTGRGKPPKRGA
jgi:hypothetical protein